MHLPLSFQKCRHLPCNLRLQAWSFHTPHSTPHHTPPHQATPHHTTPPHTTGHTSHTTLPLLSAHRSLLIAHCSLIRAHCSLIKGPMAGTKTAALWVRVRAQPAPRLLTLAWPMGLLLPCLHYSSEQCNTGTSPQNVMNMDAVAPFGLKLGGLDSKSSLLKNGTGLPSKTELVYF